MPNPPVGLPATDLKRAIGFWAGAAIVIGSIVGSGIFRTPAEIVRVLPNPGVVLALWVIFGLVSLCGALTLAELSSLIPRTGGTYVILQRAYGDGAAFTFGWMYLVGAIPASLGAVAMVFAEQLVELSGGAAFDLVSFSREGIAVGIIVVLTVINVLGVALATTVQSLFTAVKMAALAALFFLALAAGGADWTRRLDRRRRPDGRARSGGGFHHLHLQRLGLPRSGGGRGQGPRKADQPHHPERHVHRHRVLPGDEPHVPPDACRSRRWRRRRWSRAAWPSISSAPPAERR